MQPDSFSLQFNDLGETVTPFNLKEENEEGFYDKEGNYVWNKDDKVKRKGTRKKGIRSIPCFFEEGSVGRG